MAERLLVGILAAKDVGVEVELLVNLLKALDFDDTLQVAKACEIVRVKFVEHLILGEAGRWVSLQRRGAW